MTNYIRAYYHLRSMMKRAYWDQNKLRAYQDKKIREVISYAYSNSPFYHRRLRQLAIKPESIQSIEDLSKLPIVRKDELRKSLNEIVSSKFNVANLSVHRTSGSTGEPLFLRISCVEDELRKAKHLRANISCGQKLRDRWVVITSPHHFGTSTKLQRILGFYVPTPISVFNDVTAQLSIIGEMKPDVLDGYSSSILLLAREAEKQGLRPIRPRFIIGGAELIDCNSREYIENAFNAPFYDHYSCVEFGKISWQCPEKIGYHIDADSTIVQFVDGHEEVSPGERGEIVCTSLFNYAMPLIRYAVGDFGVKSDDECPCGRTLPLMRLVEGRSDSFLVFPSGQTLSPRAFTVAMGMFKHYEYIDRYRIIQKRVDLFEIYIKMKESEVTRHVVEQDLLHHIRRTFDVDTDLVTFKVVFVEDLPSDKTGKLTIVSSHVSKRRGG